MSGAMTGTWIAYFLQDGGVDETDFAVFSSELSARRYAMERDGWKAMTLPDSVSVLTYLEQCDRAAKA